MRTKLLIALLFISFSLYAQISTHEKPIGLQLGVGAIKKNVKTTKSISQPDGNFKYGVVVPKIPENGIVVFKIIKR